MVQGQVFLKAGGGARGGGRRFSYLIFSRFIIIFTFRNYPLQNCTMHLKKNHFFLPP